jgi:tetratricopeptide (TPR) repeat protein
VDVPPGVDRVLERILFGKPFKTLGEANRFFEELRAELLEMFASAGGDPDSAESLLARARQDLSDKRAKDWLGRVVDLARAELGDEYFESACDDPEDIPDAADLWLQAKILLGEHARLHEDAQEAVRNFEDVYRYMPDREIEWALVGGYLALGNAEAAKTLLDRADDCTMKWFAMALCEWQRKQKPAATLALQRALKANRHLRDFLTGRRQPPRTPNFSETPGSRGEAEECMFRMIPAWTAHPPALDWLTMQMLHQGTV